MKPPVSETAATLNDDGRIEIDATVQRRQELFPQDE
jgi:hypothetical protein